MADWEDDLLALAEDPVAPQPEKKKRKKKKQHEEVEQQKRESSASDMDVSEGSDVESKPMQSKAADSDDDSNDGDGQGEVRPDLFPYEGIYKNSEDKSRLAQMTEIERESILEERREKLQQYEDRQRLKQMVAEQDGMGAFSDSETKPSAAAGTRRKTGAGAEKLNKLDELKRKRQSKKEREEKRARRAKDGRSSGDDESDESDAYDPSGSRKKQKKKRKKSASPFAFTDDEDEDDPQDGDVAGPSSKAKSSAAARGAADAVQSVADLKHIILPRGKLAFFWPTPFFEEYVKGAFVRIGVGSDAGQPVYRLAQIDKVSPHRSSKLYDLDKHKTDLKLTLIIGNSTRDFTMQMVSNSTVSDREFDRFVIMTREAKIDLPTKAFVQQKHEYIAKWKEYTLTEADINVILEKKKSATRQRGGMELHERHTLTNERDIAKRAGDVQRVAEINEKLAQMEGASVASAPLPPALAAASNMNASPKAAFSLEERRRTLAAGVGLSTPKNTSRPGSGASTPQRVVQQAPPPAATTNGTSSAARLSNTSQQGLSQHSNFSKLLASKIDVDLGDF